VLFGENTRVLQLIQNLLYAAAVVLFSLLVKRAVGPACAVLCGALLAVDPLWLFTPQTAYSETLCLLLMVLGCAGSLKLCERASLGLALLTGIAFGLSALVREVGLFVAIAAAGVTGCLTSARRPRAASVRQGVVIVAAAVLTVLPWTIRNYFVFGRLIPITTNTAINLYMGNNPSATGRYHWSLPPDAQAVWNRPGPGSANEIAAYQRCLQSAIAYVKAHPVETVLRWPKKLWFLWGTGPVGSFDGSAQSLYRLTRLVFWPPYLLLGCWGLWLLRRNALGQMVLAAVAVGSLAHVVTYGDIRYRALYEFLLAAPAAHALTRVWDRKGSAESGGQPSGRGGDDPVEVPELVRSGDREGVYA
jgi:4-amino-4-deoxy-L-arabinose transferase-like glycosyltransferase